MESGASKLALDHWLLVGAFGPALGAVSMGLGVAVVRPAIVVDFFNAKSMVHPQSLRLMSL